MTTLTVQSIRQQISELAGLDNGYKNGIPVYFDVCEMQHRISDWRSKPMGRFQIKVDNRSGGRPTIVRSTKEGKVDWDKIIAAIDEYVRVRKAEIARENRKASNADIAKAARDSYTGKRHVSDWSGGACTVIPSSTEEGKMRVQWDFGSCDLEKAKKILAFAQSLED